MNQILVPVDGSENAGRAVRHAAALAHRMELPLRLFYVLPATSSEVTGMSGLSREEVQEKVQAAAGRAFEAARTHLGHVPGLRVEEATAIGDPATEILGRASADPGTHLVMGRRGLSRVETLLLGSVSDKVVREAPVPVTLIT